MKHHLSAAIITLLIMLDGAVASFVSTPTSVNATLGSTATFNCSANAGVIVWIVNGSTELNTPDIRTTGIGNTLSIHIPATKEYNTTVVVCAVAILGGDDLYSDPVVLTVQGLLDAVSNLRSESLGQVIRLTWDAPPSLDITGVDPDIWYRVDITVDNTPFNTVFVNIPEFSFTMDNDTSTSVIYQFRVTPINGAGDGTTSAPVTGYFSGPPRSITEDMVLICGSAIPLNVNIRITYGTIPLSVVPDLFQVHAETIDDGNKAFYCTDDIPVTLDSDGRMFIQLNTSTPTCTNDTSGLESHRRYKVIFTAKNEAGESNSTGDIWFSTHEVQSCAFTLGMVTISCTFAENSKAAGYLSILYSESISLVVFVVANRLDTSSSALNVSVPELSPNDYTVVVFDLGSDGLPVLSDDTNSYVLAAEEETITVTLPGKAGDDEVVSVNGTFLQVPDIANTEVSLCVSFTSSTSNDRIIVLVHHINDTEKLSAYLLNTTNCTTAPAPGDYVVGIFIQSDDSTLKVPATPPTISVGTVPIKSLKPSVTPTTAYDPVPVSLVVVAVTVGVSTLLVTVLIVTIVVTVCVKAFTKNNNLNKREIEMKPNQAYETVTKASSSRSARQVHIEPCLAYGVVAKTCH